MSVFVKNTLYREANPHRVPVQSFRIICERNVSLWTLHPHENRNHMYQGKITGIYYKVGLVLLIPSWKNQCGGVNIFTFLYPHDHFNLICCIIYEIINIATLFRSSNLQKGSRQKKICISQSKSNAAISSNLFSFKPK